MIFTSQVQAQQYLNCECVIGQSITLELNAQSYQKVYYLTRWQPQNIDFKAIPNQKGSFKITLKNTLLPPKRDLANTKKMARTRKNTEYFNVEEFYSQYRNNVISRDTNPIMTTSKLPTR